MLKTIIEFDRELFDLLNSILTTPFLDVLMPFVTDKANFLWLIILSWAAIFFLTGSKGKKTALVILIVILLSDQTANILKHLIQRPRPCSALADIRLLVGCGNSYSFPSNHATNIFAGMLYLSYNYRIFSSVFLAIAALVAYSRVYVGVHYPLDVAGGAFLGTALALLIIFTEQKVLAKWKKTTD